MVKLVSVAWMILGLINVFFAQPISYNQEFRVSDQMNSIRSSKFNIIKLLDGGFVVCWEKMGNVYLQLFNDDGSRYGDTFHVDEQKTAFQLRPGIAPLLNGGFAVCWNSVDSVGTSYDVYVQLYDKNGSSKGSEFRVNTYTAWSQEEPAITGLSDGGFSVCWYSGSDIYGQLYNNDGSRRGNEFDVNMNTGRAYERYNPRVEALNGDAFVVVWESSLQDGSSLGIFAQMFHNNGSRIGDEIMVNSYTLNNQAYPRVSSLSDSGFVICWESYWQDGDEYGIYAQMFNKDGTRNGDEFRVNTHTNSDQRFPDVSGVSGGGFVICWQSNHQDGSGFEIYGQQFYGSGLPRGYEFRINTYMNSDQRTPAVTRISGQRFAVCWKSDNQDGVSGGLYGKYYYNELCHPLNSFDLLEPAWDSVVSSTYVTLKWNTASSLHSNFEWELIYDLYLDEDMNFSSPIVIKNLYETIYTIQDLQSGTTYFWKVLAKNIAGDSLWSSDSFGFFVGHDATTIKHQIPNSKSQSFRMYPNFPNPFNPETTIGYVLPSGQVIYDVTVRIYDAAGRLVRVLVQAPEKPGTYSVTWDGRNAQGREVPSGVYFCSLRAGKFKASRKMLLVW